jgi:hypothetical protein
VGWVPALRSRDTSGGGAVPAEFIRAFTWQTLAELLAGAVIFLLMAVTIFRLGLKRYESGSAIQVEV